MINNLVLESKFLTLQKQWWYEGVYVGCSEGTRKLVVKEVYQHVSPETNVSHFPFIFFDLSGFSTLLVTTCLLRLFTQGLYHGT